MIEESKVLIYPSKGFMREARNAFGEQSVIVNFSPGWRLNLLKKTIDSWPRWLNDNDRLKGVSKLYFDLASFLLFSFFHVHIHAITCGCRMSYRNSEGKFLIEYSPSNR